MLLFFTVPHNRHELCTGAILHDNLACRYRVTTSLAKDFLVYFLALITILHNIRHRESVC